jgi:mevalonate kinase
MPEGMVDRYYSNGKLLLTGEYLVLQGALSLAVPTRSGQYLYVHPAPGNALHWKTTVLSEHWFECRIDPVRLVIESTDKDPVARRLLRMLGAASELRGDRTWLEGINVSCEVGFNIEWGLGSSSSLISNIAWWGEVDPYRLLRRVSQGSGYDIACARSERPVLFRTGSPSPEVSEVDFHPSFSGQLGFVYLGKKQDSAASVKNFLDHALVREKDIQRISEISERVVISADLEEYELLMSEHEEIMSAILEKATVKQALFADYPGIVKSLGAWGGDFVHISMRSGPEAAKDYFSAKGLDTLLTYEQMVKRPLKTFSND